jgi:hypothetical protein
MRYKSIILSILLYGCETWSLTLREEQRLRLFENRVLRRISRPKRDEVTGGWRKLHNEELHNLHSSLRIIRMIKSRRMRWAGHVARMRRRGMHIEFWWESQKKETTRLRPTRRWIDNVKIVLKRDRMGLVWTRLIWLMIGTNGGLLWTR